MTTSSQALSIKEKVGYALGDLSANYDFSDPVDFFSFFYTDVHKIPAGTTATINFQGGFIQACFNHT